MGSGGQARGGVGGLNRLIPPKPRVVRRESVLRREIFDLDAYRDGQVLSPKKTFLSNQLY